MHGDGAVGTGDPVLDTADFGEAGFKVTDILSSRRDPVAFDGMLDILHFVAAQSRFADWDDRPSRALPKLGDGSVGEFDFWVGGWDELSQFAHLGQGQFSRL